MDLVMFLAQESSKDTTNMVIGGACVALVILGMFYLAYGRK